MVGAAAGHDEAACTDRDHRAVDAHDAVAHCVRAVHCVALAVHWRPAEAAAGCPLINLPHGRGRDARPVGDNPAHGEARGEGERLPRWEEGRDVQCEPGLAAELLEQEGAGDPQLELALPHYECEQPRPVLRVFLMVFL